MNLTESPPIVDVFESPCIGHGIQRLYIPFPKANIGWCNPRLFGSHALKHHHEWVWITKSDHLRSISPYGFIRTTYIRLIEGIKSQNHFGNSSQQWDAYTQRLVVRLVDVFATSDRTAKHTHSRINHRLSFSLCTFAWQLARECVYVIESTSSRLYPTSCDDSSSFIQFQNGYALDNITVNIRARQRALYSKLRKIKGEFFRLFFYPRCKPIMENTHVAKYNIKSSKSIELTQTKQSEFIVVAAPSCTRQFLSKNINIPYLCATPLPQRHSHDDLLRFQQKRSMCHHRRKATIRVRQGQCNRMPISNRELPRDFSIEKMFNQSKRCAQIKHSEVTVTKMWDV